MQVFLLHKLLEQLRLLLENKNAGSGNGLLSGQTGGKVSPWNINETKLLFFTDGGSGSNEDVAMVTIS